MTVKLIAPPHTPFDSKGKLCLNIVEAQADHFVRTGVSGVFVCGTTGEGASLTMGERKDLLARWVEVSKPRRLEVIAQIGTSCQQESIELAIHAAESEVSAISALAPFYFKPKSTSDLIDYLEPITKSVGNLPFYFYDIPSLTGVSVSTLDFLRKSDRVLPTLAGVKFTKNDMAQFLECIQFENGRYEMMYGADESLLAGYAMGARSAVGSTYNFAASLYHQMIAAFDNGNLETAIELQIQAIEIIKTLDRLGFSSSVKAVMSIIGIDCGRVRAPLQPLSTSDLSELGTFLLNCGVFEFNQNNRLGVTNV